MKLPNGWRYIPFSEVADIERGRFSARPRNDPKFYGGKIPFLQTGDVSNSTGCITEFTQNLNEDGLAVSKLFSAGTLLMTIAANIGDVAEVLFDFACPDSLVAITSKAGVDNRWLRQYLIMLRPIIKSLAPQNAQANVNLQILKPLKFSVPPFSEQTAIAETLSTWDLAIEKTDKLIALKERRFKALMHELIDVGARRAVPAQGWRKVKLGEVGEISSAGVDKKINSGEVPVRLLNYLDAYRRDFIFSNELQHQVTAPKSKVEDCSVLKGDVFFTPSSETRDDIAHSAVAMEDMPGVVYSYHVVRLRLLEEWDLLFRAYAFKSNDFYRQAQELADGSGQRYVISQKSFRAISIAVPPRKEQERIGKILHAAQSEIDLLKKIRAGYQTQKRGLMQKLLTGQWRVAKELKN